MSFERGGQMNTSYIVIPGKERIMHVLLSCSCVKVSGASLINDTTFVTCIFSCFFSSVCRMWKVKNSTSSSHLIGSLCKWNTAHVSRLHQFPGRKCAMFFFLKRRVSIEEERLIRQSGKFLFGSKDVPVLVFCDWYDLSSETFYWL